MAVFHVSVGVPGFEPGTSCSQSKRADQLRSRHRLIRRKMRQKERCLVSSRTVTQPKWLLASVALTDAYTDFTLSRQAMGCTPATLMFYHYGAGRFTVWLEQQGVTAPADVTARHVRAYLAELAGRGLADQSVHGSARSILPCSGFGMQRNTCRNQSCSQCRT